MVRSILSLYHVIYPVPNIPLYSSTTDAIDSLKLAALFNKTFSCLSPKLIYYKSQHFKELALHKYTCVWCGALLNTGCLRSTFTPTIQYRHWRLVAAVELYIAPGTTPCRLIATNEVTRKTRMNADEGSNHDLQSRELPMQYISLSPESPFHQLMSSC